jgi:cation:H+ antiporter
MNFAKNFISDGIVAIVAAILLWLLARDDRKVGRRDGLFLLGAYAAYFIYLILA